MIFERKKYLNELIAGRGNGLVKIITGVRRCGKSFLLFDIWHNWLLEHGVTDIDHDKFFRINRQYIANIKGIKKLSMFFSSKLIVSLKDVAMILSL